MGRFDHLGFADNLPNCVGVRAVVRLAWRDHRSDLANRHQAGADLGRPDDLHLENLGRECGALGG